MAAQVVEFDRYGSLRIGMRLGDVNVHLGRHFQMPRSKDDAACFYVQPKDRRYALMIENGRLSRIDVGQRGIPTAEGVQVGDAIGKIKRVYGRRVVESKNAYDATLPIFTVQSADGRFAIRFITEKGRVRLIYAGKSSSVEYIEGCV